MNDAMNSMLAAGSSPAGSVVRFCGVLVACLLAAGALSRAEQLLDRVLARIGANAVTLNDVKTAVALGFVESTPGEGLEGKALQRTIDRQIVLMEVDRFPPPEPSAAEVAAEVAMMKAHAGPGLGELERSTGLDEVKLVELARQTLRIRAYLARRFGTTEQVTDDDVRAYYEDHPDEFTRGGVRMSFEDAEPLARRRASAVRLRATIDRWVDGLRMRADVQLVPGR